MTGFYHVGFAVDNLETAMADLTAAAGITWTPVRSEVLGDWPFRIVFSVDQPHIELIEGPPESPWETRGIGAHFHHLGWWTPCLEASATTLTAAGLPAAFDGCPFGRRFAYHRVDSIGAHVEIVDAAGQQSFLGNWGFDGPAGPVLEPSPAESGRDHSGHA